MQQSTSTHVPSPRGQAHEALGQQLFKALLVLPASRGSCSRSWGEAACHLSSRVLDAQPLQRDQVQTPPPMATRAVLGP